MTREAIAKQFFLDFIENLGDEYGDQDITPYVEEEANFILTDLFFSGSLNIEWNPRKHVLRLNFKDRRTKNDHGRRSSCTSIEGSCRA